MVVQKYTTNSRGHFIEDIGWIHVIENISEKAFWDGSTISAVIAEIVELSLLPVTVYVVDWKCLESVLQMTV